MAQDNEKQKKEAELNKVTEDAQKSLTDTAKDVKKKPKKEKTEVKGLTSYQEQALQGVTKSKGNKKVLIIVLILVGLAVIAGVGIALFFILKPEEEPAKAVVCKVEVLSYTVQNSSGNYVVFGSGDEFDFDEGTENSSHYTKDLNASISEDSDIAFVYLVNNITSNEYTYTFDFSDMIIENCVVTVKINNGQQIDINSERRLVTVPEQGDVALEVRFSVKDASIPDIEENTRCEGGISLTLSVS